MTVKELIEELKEYPKECEVHAAGPEGGPVTGTSFVTEYEYCRVYIYNDL